MESNEKQISQKDYLKKYLSKDKKEKKKKKVKISSSTHLKRSVLIDDDLGLPNVASIDDDEFNLDYLGDEAPQVAGIIDERPLEIRAKESHGSNKWKSVGEEGESGIVNNLVEKMTEHSNKAELNGENHSKSDIKILSVQRNKKDGSNQLYKHSSDSDLSPPRTNKKNKNRDGSDSDLLPEKKRNESRSKYGDNDSANRKKGKESRNQYRDNSDSDLSPSRKKGKESKYKYQDSDSDLSPPRKKGKESTNKYQDSDSDLSPPRRKGKENRNKYSNSDSDLSPPRIKMKSNKEKYKQTDDNRRDSGHIKKTRKFNRSSDSDLSPHRNKNKSAVKRHENDSDLSPPRKRNEYEGRKVKKKTHDSEPSRDQHRKKNYQNDSSDSDLSPERVKNNYSKEKHWRQQERRSSKGRDDRGRKRNSSPSWSTRQKRKSSDSDLSPPRRSVKDKKRQEKPIDEIKRKPRHRSSDSDLSPPRKGREKFGSEIRRKKMDKTLDGKKAGLQDAKNLKEELRKLKEAEDIAFSKLQSSVSGQNASAVMRDRKTGKIRDLEKEKQEIIEKSAKQIEREKKYEKWGKGLKQVEEAEERLAEVLHEMNKPLARYAGDDDLEKMLKSREREGDPMLDYIRSKQAESISLDNTGKPKYQGHFMPNRFGIRPGHRWDGVDRSNGYEKSWFERQNARKAIQEEAYKWSTSDM